MKFIQTLAPIASIALVVSGSSPSSYGSNDGVKISQEGVEKALDVHANGSKGDVRGAVNGAMKILSDNPTIWTSVFKVLRDPKHRKAKDSVSREGLQLHNEFAENPDSEAIKIKSIDYVYKHPEVLDLAGAIGKQVVDDHPTLIQNGFAALEKAAVKNPEVFKKIRAKAIAFSNKHEAAFEKIVEMTLKSALKDVKLSAKLAKGALKLDQLVCSGDGLANCDCEADSTYKRPQVDGETPEVANPVEPSYEPGVAYERA